MITAMSEKQTALSQKNTAMRPKANNKHWIDEYLDKWLKQKETEGRRARTIYELRHYFRSFKAFLKSTNINNLSKIKEETMQDFIYSLVTAEKKLSEGTINSRIRAIKTFFTYLVTENILKENPCRLLKTLREEKKVLRDHLKQDDLNKLFRSTIAKTKEEKQYKLIIELAYHCALRMSEARNLRRQDIRFKENILFVHEGKGGYSRAVPLNPLIKEKLKRYIVNVYRKHYRPKKGTSNHKGYLFYAPQLKRPINKGNVEKFLKKAVEKAEIKTSVVLTTLRHSIAKHLLDNGLDIRYIQKFMGHRNINTTTIYTKLNLDDLRDALKNFHPRETERSKYLNENQKLGTYYDRFFTWNH